MWVYFGVVPPEFSNSLTKTPSHAPAPPPIMLAASWSHPCCCHPWRSRWGELLQLPTSAIWLSECGSKKGCPQMAAKWAVEPSKVVPSSSSGMLLLHGLLLCPRRHHLRRQHWHPRKAITGWAWPWYGVACWPLTHCCCC